MSTMTERTAHVKPERLPFRPLLHAPEMSWAVAEDGRLSVFVKKGRREDCYHVFPLHTDLGGVAYRWHKLDGSGTVHDLTINGEHSSCSCEGWAYTDSCRHLHCTLELIEAGVLNAAPASAAGCTCGECSDADMNWDVD